MPRNFFPLTGKALMRPGHIILIAVALLVSFFAISTWRALHRRKVYQRLVDTVGQSFELDVLSVFASAGHTWLGRSQDGASLAFIPQNRKVSSKYNPDDLVFLPASQVASFDLLLDGRKLAHARLAAGHGHNLGAIKNIELHITDQEGNCYQLWLAAKASLAARVADRVADWTRFLEQAARA